MCNLKNTYLMLGVLLRIRSDHLLTEFNVVSGLAPGHITALSAALADFL